MDISILLNKTVTNLWDKTQVQQIKTITGASQALPQGLRGGREPGPERSLPPPAGWVVLTQGSLWALLRGRGDPPPKTAPSPAAPRPSGARWTSADPYVVNRRPSLAEGRASFQARLRTRRGPGKGALGLRAALSRASGRRGPVTCKQAARRPARSSQSQALPTETVSPEPTATPGGRGPPQGCGVGPGRTVLAPCGLLGSVGIAVKHVFIPEFN